MCELGYPRSGIGPLLQVDKLVASFGKGLQSLGQPAGAKVCLYADTRMEWMVAAQVKQTKKQLLFIQTKMCQVVT